MMAVLVARGADLESPFLHAASTPVAMPAATDPLASLEFAGVFATGGEVSVCLVDSHSSRSRWLTVGRPEDGILAETYDTGRGGVLLRVGDRSRWLELRRGVGTALPVAHLADGSVDWLHMKLSTKEKETEALYLMQDIMNVSADARAALQKAKLSAIVVSAESTPATTSPLR